MTWFGALGHLVRVLADLGPMTSAGLVTSTATAAVVLLTAVLAIRALVVRSIADPQLPGISRGLRARSTRTGVPRHRDPNTGGRPRPRAPSANPTVA